MIVTAVALAGLLQSCVPRVGRRTMTAIVDVESARDPAAIHDNTTGRSYGGVAPATAIATASSLLAAGHDVDLGLAQINSENLARVGLSVRDVFEPCANVRAGASILAGDYRTASARFGPGQFALRRAIGAYNTGSIFAGRTYVAAVLAAAGISAADDADVPDLVPLHGGAAAAIPAALPHRSPVARGRATARRTRSADAAYTPFTSPLALGPAAGRIVSHVVRGGFVSTPGVTPERAALLPAPAQHPVVDGR